MKMIKGMFGKNWVIIVLLCFLNGMIGSGMEVFGMEEWSAHNEQANHNNAINVNVTSGKDLYRKGRELFYNAEDKLDEAKSVLASSKIIFTQLLESDTKYYWLSQVAFTQAEIVEINGDKREAALKFTASCDLAKKALRYNQRLSDAHRLLADTYMRLMSYNGSLYSISHGPEALKSVQKAIQLDKRNFAAFDSLGIYYVSAPKIGGGDIDKGIAALNKGLASNEPFDQFISHIWLGRVYLKKGKRSEALNHLHQAQKIYPNSIWAKQLVGQCTQ
jgi:tetratricopeptide (TPR) repeat protein